MGKGYAPWAFFSFAFGEEGSHYAFSPFVQSSGEVGRGKEYNYVFALSVSASGEVEKE